MSREVRMFSRDEFGRLVAACRHRETRDLMLVLRESGCRANEVLRLRPPDVELRGSWMIITVSGKTGTRRIPLRETAPILERRMRRADPSGLLFLHPYITHYFRVRALTESLGIRHGNMLHGIRHLAATEELGSGLPVPLVRKKFGWSPGSRMLARYEHLTCEDLMRWEMSHGPSAAHSSPLFFWVNYAN